jgi:hypothetical protein
MKLKKMNYDNKFCLLLFSDLMQKENWKSLGFLADEKDNVKNPT